MKENKCRKRSPRNSSSSSSDNDGPSASSSLELALQEALRNKDYEIAASVIYDGLWSLLIFNAAKVLGINYCDLEDVVARAAAKFINKFENGKAHTKGSTIPFLKKIVHDYAVDELRARQRRPQTGEVITNSVDETSDDKRHATWMYGEALQQLRGAERHAAEAMLRPIVTDNSDALSMSELANHLGISKLAASKRWCRAPKKLQTYFENQDLL